jgi:hypothetical protein
MAMIIVTFPETILKINEIMLEKSLACFLACRKFSVALQFAFLQDISFSRPHPYRWAPSS